MKYLLIAILIITALQCEETKCLVCNGTKESSCKSCKEGFTQCPDICLKRDSQGWKKMKVAGHSDDEWWYQLVGKKTSMAYNQNHCGEIFVIENHEPVNKGKCPTCKGTTKVPCKKCNGTKKTICTDCGGDGSMNDDELVKYKAKKEAEDKKNAIVLLDGTIIKGKIFGSTSEKTTIKTEDGKMITIENSNIKKE